MRFAGLAVVAALVACGGGKAGIEATRSPSRAATNVRAFARL